MIRTLCGELGYPVTDSEMRKRMHLILSSSDDKIFVAVTTSVIGWIQISIRQSLESGLFAEIQGLIVAKTERHSGVGTALVEKAEAWAKLKNAGRIRVRTNIVRENAKTFYTKMDYTEVKTQKVFDKKI